MTVPNRSAKRVSSQLLFAFRFVVVFQTVCYRASFSFFSVLKHAETQSSRDDLVASIDKGMFELACGGN